MRTTVTLDADTDAIVRALMRERGITFKEAINEAIRSGARPSSRKPVKVPSIPMGKPKVDLDHALSLLGALEDQEILRKMRAGK